jgi:uncharacterized membrane protein HdeD (DUF308 family)
MNIEKFSDQNKSVKHWYLNLILGSIYIIVSIWVFVKPETAYISLPMVFSIALLLTGALEIIFYIQNTDFLDECGLYFPMGILDIPVSISIIILTFISKPQDSTEALTLIMGYVFLYRIVKLIVWSTELKNYGTRNLGWVFFGFVVGIILSFFYVLNQTFFPMTLLFCASFALLLIGISEIHFSFVLRKLNYRTLGEFDGTDDVVF